MKKPSSPERLQALKHVRDGVSCHPIWVNGRRPPSLQMCSIEASASNRKWTISDTNFGSKSMILVPHFDLKFLNERAAPTAGTSNRNAALAVHDLRTRVVFRQHHLRKMTASGFLLCVTIFDPKKSDRSGACLCSLVHVGPSSCGALDETGGGGVMSPRRLAVLAGLCGTVVLAGWVAAGLARLGSPGIENTGAPIEDSRATSVIRPRRARRRTASNRTGRGRCLRRRYGERRRRFARPSSDAAARGATRAVGGGESG